VTIRKVDPLFAIRASPKLDEKFKRRITAKISSAETIIADIEKAAGADYPTYYIDPTLTISVSSDNYGGIGILYARTIPVASSGTVEIVVQLSAPLLLYSAKRTLRLVLAHEFLHYLELVKQFTMGGVSSDLSSSSLFEERYKDANRAVTPQTVFPKKTRLTKDLESDFQAGFSDEKLNEKCRKLWIEKGLPTVKIQMGSNQTRISMDAVARSKFDPKIIDYVKKLAQSE
jgi:hypothetical protein